MSDHKDRIEFILSPTCNAVWLSQLSIGNILHFKGNIVTSTKQVNISCVIEGNIEIADRVQFFDKDDHDNKVEIKAFTKLKVISKTIIANNSTIYTIGFKLVLV